MKPTVFKRLCGRFRILKISFKYPWTFYKYLPVWSNLHLQPWQGLPNFPDLKVAFATDRGNSCALCLAISLNEGKSNGIEEFQHIRGDRCGSGVSDSHAIEA